MPKSSASAEHGEGQHLILYDGVCGLCNRVNAFVLARDVRGVFVFASLQSPTGQRWMQRSGKITEGLDTFYVVMNFQSQSPALLTKSRAALFVLKTLGGFWRGAALFELLPVPLLDVLYDLIARNRYRFFGRYETCLLPSPDYSRRFIDP